VVPELSGVATELGALLKSCDAPGKSCGVFGIGLGEGGAPTLPIGERSEGPPMVPIAEPGTPLPSDDPPSPLPIVPIDDWPPLTAVPGAGAGRVVDPPPAAHAMPDHAPTANMNGAMQTLILLMGN
jgi:hypothetical protein